MLTTLPAPPAPALDVPEGLPRRHRTGAGGQRRRGAGPVRTRIRLPADGPVPPGRRARLPRLPGLPGQAAEQRLADLRTGPGARDRQRRRPAPSLADFFAHLDRVPDWVDFDQIHRGAVAFWRAGPLVPMVLAYSVIGVGFTDYAASRPVLFSGRMTSRDQVGQRLLESFRFIARAYTPGGMVRTADGFKHTARVRMIHATVRHTLSRSPDWDWLDWGIPINNFDSIDTQAGKFGVEVIDSLARSGVKLSARERADIFALTRYVGYVIGVPEDQLHTDEESARRIHELHKLLEPGGDEGCRQIVRSIIDFSCEESLGG